MRTLCLLAFLASFSLATHATQKQPCTPQEQPKVLKPIDNWSIIANNHAVIKVAPYFSGSKLTYSMTHQPVKSKNKISINSTTGEITINAETRDNFDLNITAKNSCGVVKSTFNVQIDEEE